jgi:hypothetical protein
MLLLAHGDLGSWDELVIVLVGFVVLWVAVKLAGRKPAAPESEGDGDRDATQEEQESAPPVAPQR